MLKIYTIQIAVAKRLELIKDPRCLDITVKSGDKAFAPTWKMVMGSKEGRITQEEYTRQYYDLMRKSYRQNRERWDEILAADEVILACYCRADSFCHRYLLKDMLMKSGAVYVREIEARRDISVDPSVKLC